MIRNSKGKGTLQLKKNVKVDKDLRIVRRDSSDTITNEGNTHSLGFGVGTILKEKENTTESRILLSEARLSADLPPSIEASIEASMERNKHPIASQH